MGICWITSKAEEGRAIEKHKKFFLISLFAHVKLMIYLNTCERQEAGSTLC